MNILLVDDNEATNFLHKKLLEKENIFSEIFIVTDGEKAFKFISEYEMNYSLPLIVLLDLNMPRVNGWDFLDTVAKNNRSFVPQNCNFILLTTSDNPSDLERSNQYPLLKGLLKKPLIISDLTKVISQKISL